ncbi:TPA: sugar O-acetyltransferase, partial [Clostridioides difficile]
MNINEFLTHINQRKPVSSKSEIHEFMVKLSNEAMKITSKLNSSYHEPEEVRSLFSELIGKKVDESFFMFPPFYTDCGKNI